MYTYYLKLTNLKKMSSSRREPNLFSIIKGLENFRKKNCMLNS